MRHRLNASPQQQHALHGARRGVTQGNCAHGRRAGGGQRTTFHQPERQTVIRPADKRERHCLRQIVLCVWPVSGPFHACGIKTSADPRR